MTAAKLKMWLLGLLALSAVTVGALIYLASNFLASATTETTHAKIDAELSAQDLERLKSMETKLAQNKQSVDKAMQIVSQSQQYQYQDQIIKDVNRYASQSNISVVGYNFGVVGEEKKTTKKTEPIISGVRSIPVEVTLATPMNYTEYLEFLKLLEQNISKMQVTGISMAPSDENSNQITNPSVGLIVYVR